MQPHLPTGYKHSNCPTGISLHSTQITYLSGAWVSPNLKLIPSSWLQLLGGKKTIIRWPNNNYFDDLKNTFLVDKVKIGMFPWIICIFYTYKTVAKKYCSVFINYQGRAKKKKKKTEQDKISGSTDVRLTLCTDYKWHPLTSFYGSKIIFICTLLTGINRLNSLYVYTANNKCYNIFVWVQIS